MKDYFSTVNSTNSDLKERRHKVAKFVKLGKRVGYTLWLVAIILFFSLFFTDFDGPLVGILLVCLIAGCIILLPSIVLSYAVRAAEREEREQSLNSLKK
jgi:NADH:ubiquinone oxidoreductase subunit 6 (subunit J)|tara:strand:- start:41406 stop:41702 length:297 start_codon:yes stop_codon:yes gene_type:complete